MTEITRSMIHYWGGPVPGLVDNVWQERQRQLAKWGEQHHPDGTGGPEAEFQANWDRAVCEQKAELGTLTWADILKEEASEAFAEDDVAKLRAELVQVAAVAAAWIEDIDSRQGHLVPPVFAETIREYNEAATDPAKQIHWGVDYIEKHYGGDRG
jgi:hypothetical protein